MARVKLARLYNVGRSVTVYIFILIFISGITACIILSKCRALTTMKVSASLFEQSCLPNNSDNGGSTVCKCKNQSWDDIICTYVFDSDFWNGK